MTRAERQKLRKEQHTNSKKPVRVQRGALIEYNYVHGYYLSLRDPEVRSAYEQWKTAKGIPQWCPLSDQQRRDFERDYMRSKGKAATV